MRLVYDTPQKLVTNENKRHHSNSSDSEPSPPKVLQHVSKKLFLIRNRFGLLKSTDTPDETTVEEMQSIVNPVSISSKPPPPIFIRGKVTSAVCAQYY